MLIKNIFILKGRMVMNFMTAKTKIEDMLSTRQQIFKETADLVTGSIIDRAQTKGINNIDSNVRDIDTLLAGFSAEERVTILEMAIVKLAANGKFGYNNDSGKKKDGGGNYNRFLGGNRY
jgi:hypothetical protein